MQNNCTFSTAIGFHFNNKCTEKSIDNYYDDIEKSLKAVHPGFIYNFDEVGFQEYVDSREVTVIVPILYICRLTPQIKLKHLTWEYLVFRYIYQYLKLNHLKFFHIKTKILF